MKPLAIGHKSMLRTLKNFAAYCKAGGSPIVDWTVITKKDFDDFRCSRACMHAIERDDTIAPPTMPVTTSKDSPSAGGEQGDFELTDGEALCTMSCLRCFTLVGERDSCCLKHWRGVCSMIFKMYFS